MLTGMAAIDSYTTDRERAILKGIADLYYGGDMNVAAEAIAATPLPEGVTDYTEPSALADGQAHVVVTPGQTPPKA